eukprot:Hpha_TRINITY_DN15329_c8_g1::TRINITY_DN15329_c8_g1_i1::g.89484::m.89484
MPWLAVVLPALAAAGAPLALQLKLSTSAPTFPPGGATSVSGFWTASPMTQDPHPLPEGRCGPDRPAKDFVASGEAAMLGWNPPEGAEYVNPLVDTQSLVRILGGLPSHEFPPATPPSAGDLATKEEGGVVGV